ncbi:MAG: hypoxanthine phosphoribosyltransferase [Chlamydiales bacterium]|nr:hypoxanthine phosphoribosyltransferase [Chlamydiales bacterium]
MYSKDNLTLLLSKEEIALKVQEIAKALNKTYKGEKLTIVMVMKGSFFLTADLVRYLEMPVVIEYIRAGSYGYRGTSRGELVIQGIEDLELQGKHVLVIDDIFDSGLTMQGITTQIQKKNPKSIKSLVLLFKNVNRSMTYVPDYFLFTIQDQFVVGYGLDYKEQFRNLPDIYSIT